MAYSSSQGVLYISLIATSGVVGLLTLLLLLVACQSTAADQPPEVDPGRRADGQRGQQSRDEEHGSAAALES